MATNRHSLGHGSGWQRESPSDAFSTMHRSRAVQPVAMRLAARRTA